MHRETPYALAIALLLMAGLAWAEAPQQSPLPPAAPARDEAPEAEATEEAGEPEPEQAAAEEDAGVDPEVDEPGGPEPAETAGEDAGVDPEVDESGEPIVVAPPGTGPERDTEAEAECLAALPGLGVEFEVIEPLTGEGPCGAPAPLRVTAIDGIELRPEIRVRCPVAEALALWVNRVAAPLAELYMDQPLSAILTGTDYQCRRRRGDATAKWSEHAFANAVDVSGVVFGNGEVMAVEPRGETSGPERLYQAGIRGGACAFFTTVLGPATNAAHADHLHLDMAQRRGGYRLCE